MKQVMNKGFTLIELMVVIGIIVLLATLMVVNYQGASKKARDSRRAADLEQLRSALEIEYTDNNQYPANLSGLPGNLATQGPKQNNADDYVYNRLTDHTYTICAEGWENSATVPAQNDICTGANAGKYGVSNP